MPQYYTNQFYDKVKDIDTVSKMQYLDINMWFPFYRSNFL